MFFEKDFIVDAGSVDMFRQCRPSALLGYIQEAATLAALDLGVSGPEIFQKYHCLWMVARTWVQMEKPLRWNEKFTIRTWHRGASGASSYRDFDFLQNGKPFGQGVTIWVMVEADSRKLFRMKDLAEFQDTSGGDLCKKIKLRRVKMPERFDAGESRSMGYSDTDINGHVNNVHYADFACDALHLERYGAGKLIREFQIDYIGECRAGETIDIGTAVQENQLFARGRGQDGGERFDFSLTLEKMPVPCR